MHENRTAYPRAKSQMFAELQEIPRKYRVMALVKMDKVRASQILPLRKKLKGDVEFFSVKDKVARKALELLDIPGIREVAGQLTGQCMFLFTDMSPFRLNVLLAKNSVMMAARAGDTASIDVVVRPVNTGVAPGPMLTEFKEAGIPTKIDQGTIWITKETVPVKKGEVVSEKLASLLGKLDIKPVEAGIALESALEEGTVYARDEMVIDVDGFREDLARSHQEAVALTVEIGYVTADNIRQILGRAAQSARSVSAESGYMTDETGEQILQKASGHARSLAERAKGYTPA